MELKFERVCLPLLLLHVNRCGKGPGDWQRKAGTQGRAAGEGWQGRESGEPAEHPVGCLPCKQSFCLYLSALPRLQVCRAGL